MRVVVSLTSIPSRVSTVNKVITSILNQDYQVNQIYLTLPKSCAREGIPYVIPKLDERVKIIRTDTDFGPITKLIGALIIENDPETYIITVDDDRIYDKRLVRHLLSYREKGSVGVVGMIMGHFPFYIQMSSSYFPCWTPISINKSREVDGLAGFGGVLYQRKFFDVDALLRYTYMDRGLFLNDDMVISGYLSIKKVPRYLTITDIGSKDLHLSNALSGNVFFMLYWMWRALVILRKEGAFEYNCDITCNLSFVVMVTTLITWFFLL